MPMDMRYRKMNLVNNNLKVIKNLEDNKIITYIIVKYI